jgi:hypothetical protein
MGSIGGILFDLPLLALTNTQEGIGRKSISIGTPHGNGNPPLCLQQPAPKPSIFPSASDLQHSFMYLWKVSESSTLISLIFVVKSEFSCILAHPTT